MKVLCISLLLCMISMTQAQVITISDTNASGIGNVWANDHLYPTHDVLGFFTYVTDTCNLDNFTAGLYGNDFATICFANAQEYDSAHGHFVNSEFGSRAFINGANTSTVEIKWKNTGHIYATSDGHFANLYSFMTFNVGMTVTGIPAGTSVTVYYWYNIFAV